jgi:hypothetical protein
MTKYAVFDVTYVKMSGYGLAATYLYWVLEKHGIKPVPVDQADIVLLTMNSPEQLPQLRTWKKKQWNGFSRLILGGVSNPGAVMLDNAVDAVVCGEGHNFMEMLLTKGWKVAKNLPEVWNRGQTERVIPNNDFPWEMPPLNAFDGTVRVFGSRGCRYRCMFCQTGWASRYVRNPNPGRLKAEARALHKQGAKIAMITNDGTDPKVSIDVPQSFVSARYDGLLKMDLKRGTLKSVRIGVEGVSERMRSAINKPIPHEGLMDLVFDLNRKKLQVKLFYVAGLPGETDEDWEELMDFQRRLRHITGPRVSCNLHTFLPLPAAPLGVLPLEDSYWERLSKFKKWAVGGEGWTKKILNVFGARPQERNKRAILNMGAPLADLRRGWFEHDNPNWIIKTNVEPAGLRKLARKYADKVGMKI